MSLAQRTSIAILCPALLCFTGCCVGPVACGPHVNGPLALNNCDGCSECDGCGELYVDPWINHPADACDPCDCCGNYNGRSCGKCRPVFHGWKSLWGYRRDAPCDGCGNTACGGGCDVGPDCCGPSCDGCSTCSTGTPGEIIEYAGEPTPAEPIASAEPIEKPAVVKPYKPRRTRQIFRPKSRVARGDRAITIDY